jgi:hypothetical protein
MNTSLVSTISLTTALFTLSACGGGVDVGSTSGSVPKASGATGQRTPPNEAAALPPSLSIQGFVHDAHGASLSGVQVCLQAGPEIALDIGDCATSTADGSFALHGMPQEILLTIAFEKKGYVPAIRAIQMKTSDIELPSDENRMLPTSTPPVFAGAPLDATTGGIRFFVDSDSGEPAPASAWIASFENPNVDYEAVYFDAAGNVVSGAQAGSSGAFGGLPTGSYAVTFYSDTGSCTPKGDLYGQPLGETSILVPVVEGHVTMPVGADCTANQAAVARWHTPETVKR